MACRSRIFARAMSLLGLALAGCVAQGAQLAGVDGSLAVDLSAAESPRLARLQRSDPPRPGAPSQASYRPEPPREAPGRLTAGDSVKVRAYVNGKPIFDDELQTLLLPDLMRIQRLAEPQRSEQMAKSFNGKLNELIDDEVVYQDAASKLEKINPKAIGKLKDAAKKEHDKGMRAKKEANKWTDEQFMAFLRENEPFIEVYRRHEERKFIAMEYMRSRIFPLLQSRIGHQEIREYYQTHLNEFQTVDKVKWQNIFLAVGPKHATLADARKFADHLIQRLRGGEDIALLLQFDDGNAKFNRGFGYGQRRGEIKPAELEEHLFKLRPGEIGPPVAISTGVHLYRVVSRDYAGQLPFSEEVQTAIRNKLRNELAQQEYRRILRELKTRAIIELVAN